MTPAPQARPPGAPAARRRLTREARRHQLVSAAMPIVADGGLAEFALDDVAAAAGVTRNLLYHYFPRGRADVAVAVVERAGRELTGGWVTDEDLSLEQRLAANFARVIDHALRPTMAWRIHRLARASGDPEVAAIHERFGEVVVASISLNHLGTPEPPPLVRVALRGYLAFFETALDEARRAATSRDELTRLLTDTLVAAVQAALAAAGREDQAER